MSDALRICEVSAPPSRDPWDDMAGFGCWDGCNRDYFGLISQRCGRDRDFFTSHNSPLTCLHGGAAPQLATLTPKKVDDNVAAIL